MGIYTIGSIYGIRIYTYDALNDSSVTLFTKKYEKIMTKEQLKEVYLFYKELRELRVDEGEQGVEDDPEMGYHRRIIHIKTDIHFQIYTECTSTHELQNRNFMNFMTWYPISLSFFLEKFNGN